MIFKWFYGILQLLYKSQYSAGLLFLLHVAQSFGSMLTFSFWSIDLLVQLLYKKKPATSSDKGPFGQESYFSMLGRRAVDRTLNKSLLGWTGLKILCGC